MPPAPQREQIRPLPPNGPAAAEVSMEPNIPVNREELAAFCKRNHIRKLWFFGSILRDDFRPDSDVDVLYEFDPGHAVGFFELGAMEQDLSSLLGHRKVEMINPNFLNRW